VYDGDYALKCSGYEGDEYVESTATVTLEANTTYSLSAMFWHEDFDEDNPSTVYVKLINQGAGDDVTVSRAVALWRGIQLTETQFTTDATNLTYKIQAGAIIPSGATTYEGYVDDIKIQRTLTYGVAVSAKSWNPAPHPGVTRYGDGTNAIINNGTIIQGQDNGTWSHAIFNYSTPNTTVDHMSITVSGANSSALKGRDTTSWVITDNDLTSNVRTISARDHFDGAVINDVGGTISGNRIHNGPHAGIYATRGTSTVDNNTIQLKTKYTNAFAILAGNGSEIHHNTIDCGSGEFTARGIGLGGNTSGIIARIHRNIITVQGTTDNQEYGGAMIGGAYGIQVENGKDIEIYENTVTAIANTTEAYAFRMNDGGENVYVHDNVFRAIRTGSGVDAAVIKLSNVSGTALRFEHNTLETNNQYLGSSSSVDGVQLVGSVLKASGDLTGFRAIETSGIVHDLKWVDNAYFDATSKTLLTNASVLNGWGGVDSSSSFIHSFTTTLRVEDGSDTPLAGAAVVLTDKDDAEVYSGETGDDGTVDVVVDEFRTVGDVKTSYSPYTASATSGELSGSDEFTANKVQTITVTVT